MKKTITILLSLCFLVSTVSFTACSKSPPEDSPNSSFQEGANSTENSSLGNSTGANDDSSGNENPEPSTRPTEGLEYTLSKDESYYICSGLGTATTTDIVIASTYKNLPVSSIRNNAFV